MLASHGEERTRRSARCSTCRRRDLPVHRDSRGRGGDPRRGGHEIVRHGAGGFLGELNLLSGQTVFVTAVVTAPLRYIALDRDEMRALLFDDGPLSDLLLSSFIARREALQRQGVGMEIVGPHSSEPTRRIIEFAQRNRLPYTLARPRTRRGRSAGR